jgi:hypothetical protein
MASITPSPPSQLLGLQVDSATGGGASLAEEIKNKVEEMRTKKKLGTYGAGQDVTRFSPLSQWMARNL